MGVPHAPVGRFGDHGQAGGSDGDCLLLRDLHEVVDDVLVGDLAELEVLTAGNDGRRDLVEFRRREDEDRVRRRLLQGFEKGVKGVRREHVDFVDDEDLVTGVDGFVLDHLTDRLDVVDLTVGGAVDLQDVDGAAFVDGLAELAGMVPVGAGMGRGAVEAVQGFGQNTGDRCLARAPHTGEKIGLGDAAGGDSVLDGPDDGQLSDDFLEHPRSVFPREYLVRHGFRPSVHGRKTDVSPKK